MEVVLVAQTTALLAQAAPIIVPLVQAVPTLVTVVLVAEAVVPALALEIAILVVNGVVADAQAAVLPARLLVLLAALQLALELVLAYRVLLLGIASLSTATSNILLKILKTTCLIISMLKDVAFVVR